MSQKKLIWLDLEMTGLNFETDFILEIATIITNDSLEIIAVGPSFVIHHPEEVLLAMDDWNKNQHTKSGLWQKVLDSTITLQQAEQQTLAFVKQYCTFQDAPLCGNSIYQDRSFLRRHMRELAAFFHYRIIDVSSVKELVRRWYPHNSNVYFKKAENHRALDDVYASIEELKHYRKHFFIGMD
ncbi:MAG: oligoribonuclease [Candidatus Babeliaceae bacterium]|jgi:oligoribonuclease